MTGTVFPTWTANQIVPARGLNSISSISAWKLADTSKISNVTVAADPDLVVDTGIGVYILEAFINFFAPSAATAGGSAGDIKVGFSLTTSTTLVFSNWIGQGQGTAALTDFRGMGRSVDGTTQPFGGAGVAGSGNFQTVSFNGMFQPAVPGTLSLVWAQNISNPLATVVRRGSWLKITQVA